MGDLPPPPPPLPVGPSGYGPAPRAEGSATTALILGIIGLVLCGIITGIPAIVIGLSAQKKIDASGGQLTGRGSATAGIILGALSVVWSIVGLVVVLARV